MKIQLSIMVLMILMGCQSAKDMGSTDKKDPEGEAEKIEHDLSMYPAPTEEIIRHIIALPGKENEADYKIEFYAGKTTEVDCNKHRLAGGLEEKTIEGWGYPYFEFKTSGQVMSTRMACPKNSLKEEFVQAPSLLKSYNSKLPVVVYNPKGYEVRFRVWKREDAEFKASQK